MRLDAFLVARFPSSTRALVRDAIARASILLCGKPAEKGMRVRAGDEIAIKSLLEAADNRAAPDPAVADAIASRIVYDDGTLLAIDKPAGMAVQPLSPLETGTLANGVVALRPEFAVVANEPLAAGAVHRIDTGTSGLVVFAANNFVYAAMRTLFAERAVLKKYLALAQGAVARPGAIACELAHAPYLDHCRMVEFASLSAGERFRSRPLYAETRFRPLARIGADTLLEVEIETGVTHQIRAQLALAGHPIVGDTLYGAAPLPGGGFRLHSLSAAFSHPSTGAFVTISTPPPPWAEEDYPALLSRSNAQKPGKGRIGAGAAAS